MFVFTVVVFLSAQPRFAFWLVTSVHLRFEWLLICKGLLLPSYCLPSGCFVRSLFLPPVSPYLYKAVVFHSGMFCLPLFMFCESTLDFCFVVITSSMKEVTTVYLFCQRGSQCCFQKPSPLFFIRGEGRPPWKFSTSPLLPNSSLSHSSGILESPFRQAGLPIILFSMVICPVLHSPGSFFSNLSEWDWDQFANSLVSATLTEIPLVYFWKHRWTRNLHIPLWNTQKHFCLVIDV